ncbi:MAG: ATP-binding protein [Betaproteobacteria bacterium]|jgi:nitrogen fixation/metabolism regulation signal transduction histidine kinase|nr:ATP-binding protein [Betaproteobacteria bacterium]
MNVTAATAKPQRSGMVMRYLMVGCVVLGVVAVFLLASVSANNELFSDYYPVMLAVNLAIAGLIAGMVTWQLLRLRRRLREGEFGAKLTLRLVTLFGLMAVLPGALIYGVSVQFVSQSIESWFEVRLDSALESGLNLGRSSLDGRLKDLSAKAEAMALSLSSRPAPEQIAALHALREQAAVEEAALYTARGRLITFSGTEKSSIAPEGPNTTALRQVRLQKSYGVVESLPERGLYLRVLAPVDVVSLTEDARVLQLLQSVPQQLAQNAEAVQAGYREYQELQLARRGLKRLYGITLTLALLLAVLSSLGLAVLLSNRLSAPLSALVEGTRAVAQGDFSRRAAVASRDELGQLTQSFNSMTLQLAEAQSRVERNQAQLAHAKAYLESVLANLSAGVLTFDTALRLRSANPSATQILGTDCAALVGVALQEWPAREVSFAALSQVLAEAFEGASTDTAWQRQVERELRDGTQVLLLRATRFGEAGDGGLIVVFDDVTHLLQAQRDAAWAEVARRLAHEIKNPLTPIQLSAERLQLKLAPKLQSGDAEILGRSTQTIVSQVAALKRMVDAFSQYARNPEPALRPLDLNALVREVLTLYESLGSSLALNLAATLPAVEGDSTQIRQVIHNLLQNAQDALAGVEEPRIEILTALHGSRVELSVTDNGSGFPENLMKRAFEPYVTTKPRGTGLGLSIVRKIVEEHHGEVAIGNVSPRGARVSILLPAMRAGERSAA